MMNIDNQLLQLECQRDAISCIQCASSSGDVGNDTIGNALLAIYFSMDNTYSELSKIAESNRKAGAVNE